ncbi:MAG: oligoendopeptidase F [Firmicutes bacterium]|nr:oligoendopeptidase F [Bacillota bacterium]
MTVALRTPSRPIELHEIQARTRARPRFAAGVSSRWTPCERNPAPDGETPDGIPRIAPVHRNGWEGAVLATQLPGRHEVPLEHTWDAASVFPSDEAWEAEVQRLTERLPELSAFQGRLGESPGTLADFLETLEQVLATVGKIYVYGMLRFAVDTADQQAAAVHDRARSVFSRAMAAVSFSEPEMLAVGAEKLARWAQEEPRLAIYRHYFDTLARRKEHVRSAEVEELLSLVQDPFRTAASVHGVISDADLKFRPAKDSRGQEHEVAQGTIDKLLHARDRELRRSAWESYADGYLALKNGLANCLAAGVKQNVFLSRARRFRSALEAALSSNHIPVDVFYNLIETYRKHLPIWHRYWRVRKRALGYDALYPYDTRASLVDKEPVVSYEQAVEWIAAGMRPLGEEYVSVLRRGCLKERWVDRYPNKGKQAGAFSMGWKGTHPFILMNYTDDLSSLSTLAHELGHSMHSYLTHKSQPMIYADYSIFVAEVASNFNQALVRHYLFETQTDRDFQIALIEEAMGNFHRYFFVMPTLARFELAIHEQVERGEALTAERMIRLMADLFREGYGDEVIMDEERVGITWAQFPTHLYANFYVYQYATGISGAHALAQRVLSGEPGAAEAYLEFLKAGSSMYPLDALKMAGVDLTTPKPVEETFQVLAGLVDRLERLTS